VQEIVRELAAIEDIRSKGQQELKDDPNSAPSNITLSFACRYSTSVYTPVQHEPQTSIARG